MREKERERERRQQVRSGSARRKNDAASSRRVQNSAGIPGVSSPMGNNEDSASFITTCSSIPDLTSRAPTSGIHPGSSPFLLSATPFLARARERDVSEAPGVCLALKPPRSDTCTHTSPPMAPYFQPVPTDARRLPRKRSRLGYSEPRDRTRYSAEGYRVRVYIYMNVRAHVCDRYTDKDLRRTW